MQEQTIFPREEKAEALFQKILDDPWACAKLEDTFCHYLFCSEDQDVDLPPEAFTRALFNAYIHRDMSAFLMAISQNTMFDLLRNAYLIPYRFNADGKENPIIMTDEEGQLLPAYQGTVHEKSYRHFNKVYQSLGDRKNIFFAQAYCYSHDYGSEEMDVEQKVLGRSTGVLLIRELPDTVKAKKTEAEAYSAVWDLMIELEKQLPKAYVFYGQDTLLDHDDRYDELGIFLPDSLFLKNLERHVAKAEAIIYG
ncbi:DUF4866 domain-containing protein [Pseudoramibacter sp.]|jgi:hypothetical protein|uniref:DUF4866 domain-containing protein n=1 Tax=Pseudoramibacter sp. TaxID=2034862 RepID=UPI0025FDCFCD|nr:DUF4866 domain-containing protein [Pseudoramibacter sp.]MCH4071847.1 DUF4866 domain-containing protein [Pseudoramibacter sp.]MCH4105616.1 DUF4866 domain-containing protein [Pseudoramibacter sp.]